MSVGVSIRSVVPDSGALGVVALGKEEARGQVWKEGRLRGMPCVLDQGPSTMRTSHTACADLCSSLVYPPFCGVIGTKGDAGEAGQRSCPLAILFLLLRCACA